MYACIYHIHFFKISLTVQTTNIFRANKKTEVSDPPREACSCSNTSGMSLAKRYSDLHRGKTYMRRFFSWFIF